MGIIVDLSLTVFISLGAPILIVQKTKTKWYITWQHNTGLGKSIMYTPTMYSAQQNYMPG